MLGRVQEDLGIRTGISQDHSGPGVRGKEQMLATAVWEQGVVPEK